MNASLVAVLNDAERLLVAETDTARLAELDEDAAIELETRIRRARNKYAGQYRRAASARVADLGGRGTARPENKRAAMKTEAFEEGLSRVSRRVSVLARQSAARLRAERLEAARAAKQNQGPNGRPATRGADRKDPAVSGAPTGDRALRSPTSEKRRASTLASGDRKQAKRDTRQKLRSPSTDDTGGRAGHERRAAVCIHGSLAHSRAGPGPRGRGLPDVPRRGERENLTDVSGAGPGASRPVRHLRRRHQRQHLAGGGYRAGVHDHECGQALCLRPGVRDARRRTSPAPTRRECDRACVRLAGLRRAQRGRPVEPDGQCRGHRRHQPGTR